MSSVCCRSQRKERKTQSQSTRSDPVPEVMWRRGTLGGPGADGEGGSLTNVSQPTNQKLTDCVTEAEIKSQLWDSLIGVKYPNQPDGTGIDEKQKQD